MLKPILLKRPFHLLIIITLGLLIYSNTFNSQFVFDDKLYITDNPTVKDVSYILNPSEADGLRLKKVVNRYLRTRPVAYLTFWANYALGGLAPRGFHITNLAIHIAAALLVYTFVLVSFRTPRLKDSALSQSAGGIALMSAILFICHPVQTESITYITQRFGSLAAMFYLMSITAYTGSRVAKSRTPRWTLYALCLISAVLAMKSKETAFTLPVAIAMYEFMFFSGGKGRRLLMLLPLMLTMLIIPLEYLGGSVGAGIGEATRLQTDMPRHEYLFTQLRVIVTYMRLLLLPINQNFDYDIPVYVSFFEPVVLVSFFVLASVLGLGVYMLLRSCGEGGGCLAAFGVFWFFLALSVESSVIPISELMFEYRLYLPGAGFLIAVSTAAFVMRNRMESSWGRSFPIVLALAVGLMATAAYARNDVWSSRVSIWLDAAGKSPYKARPHNNLGLAYYNEGLLDPAIRAQLVAIRLNPELAEAHLNLGAAYGGKGLVYKAIESYNASLKIQPDNAGTHDKLGSAYSRVGLSKDAIRHYVIALELNPNLYSTHRNLGNVYMDEGNFEKAIEHFSGALQTGPTMLQSHSSVGDAYSSGMLSFNASVHNRLADAYRGAGLNSRAIEHYNAALELNPNLASAHNNLGNIYLSAERLDEAIGRYQHALRISPDFAMAHNNLGVAYGRKDLVDREIESYSAALKLMPGLYKAHNNLGIAYLKKEAYDISIEHFREALRLKPDYNGARANLKHAIDLKRGRED
jgi:tetratricopeptide (TPR) repeat protein